MQKIGNQAGSYTSRGLKIDFTKGSADIITGSAEFNAPPATCMLAIKR